MKGNVCMAESMNIMVIGDDHGADIFGKAYRDALSIYKQIDAVIHTGDSERVDDNYYQEICGMPILAVKGNNDYNMAPPLLVVTIGGKKIFVTHGHRYGVYMGVQSLYYAGVEQQADIIIYGHTHRADHIEANGVDIINPGSLSGVRSGSCTYAIISIDIEGNVQIKFHQINQNH